MKANRYTLHKLEELLKELDYEILYEKGTFSTGSCIVEQQRKLVINTYYNVPARVEALWQMIRKMKIEEQQLSKKSKAVLDKVKKLDVS